MSYLPSDEELANTINTERKVLGDSKSKNRIPKRVIICQLLSQQSLCRRFLENRRQSSLHYILQILFNVFIDCFDNKFIFWVYYIFRQKYAKTH